MYNWITLLYTWNCCNIVYKLRKRVKVKSLSPVWLFTTPWTVAYQVPPSMGFSRQEYWSGLPLPSPGDLPNPGIEPGSPALQTDALQSKPPGKFIVKYAADSVWPHRQQPTRLLRPWDFLFVCLYKLIFILLIFKFKESVNGCPWDFLGKCTGVGCHCLLQGSWL